MSSFSPPVLIVGGGLAGLACASHLHAAGVEFQLLEGSDAVGGRVRTDAVDGFLLDRGFQVFLDAYPEAGALLDKRQLKLHAFEPGAWVWRDRRLWRVMDVFRSPRHFWSSAFAPVGSLADKLRVALLKWRLSGINLKEIAAHEDFTTEHYLRRAGFSAQMIDVFFRSFYGGIFLERELRTSSRMFEFTFKMFSQGHATLPAAGMGEIPRQLASRLPPEKIRLHQRVASVHSGGLVLQSGENLAGQVVVATDAKTARKLVPGLAGTEPSWRSVTCIYFAANQSPLREAIIALNGAGTGLVNNLCVPSDVAPGYAPPGQSLISVSVLGIPPLAGLEGEVLGELEGWFGVQVREWRHLRTETIERALPEQAPHAGMKGNGYLVQDGVYVCGDHQWSASIEGAILSGKRTAEAILKNRD
ncbi:MAG: hypothetical protein RLZZ399_2567 [Verrucomicrobiota bacterium]|jgi:phytoene dehydrogenase-like protein